MNNDDEVRQHLNMALENVLAAFVLSGGDLGADVPTDAVDAALSTNPSVRDARQALDVAVRGLLEPGAGDDRHQALLGVEEATNALVVASADTAYQLGVRVGRGLKG